LLKCAHPAMSIQQKKFIAALDDGFRANVLFQP